MKRKVLFLVMMFVMSFTCQAQNGSGTQIDFNPQYINPTGTLPPKPKSPVQSPTVYIEENVLTFSIGHSDYDLYIKDENDVVVYSYYVAASTNTVVLPSTLSGSYRIELVTDDWLFWGYILL